MPIRAAIPRESREHWVKVRRELDRDEQDRVVRLLTFPVDVINSRPRFRGLPRREASAQSTPPSWMSGRCAPAGNSLDNVDRDDVHRVASQRAATRQIEENRVLPARAERAAQSLPFV
jgi:hypothetical protein